MIDENLMRANLQPSDRARQTIRRQEIYEALHPEAKAGAIRARAANESMGRVVGDNLSPTTFAEATAAAIGKDPRSVQRDAERGRMVIDEALELIRGTALDTGVYLDKIKKLPPNEQVAGKNFMNYSIPRHEPM
jgi:hypothetical protein